MTKQTLMRKAREYCQTAAVLSQVVDSEKNSETVKMLASEGLRHTLNTLGNYLQMTSLDMDQPLKECLYSSGGLFIADSEHERLKTQDIPQFVRKFESQLKIMAQAA